MNDFTQRLEELADNYIKEINDKEEATLLYFYYKYNNKYNYKMPILLSEFSVLKKEPIVKIENNKIKVEISTIGIVRKEVAEYMFKNNINVSEAEKLSDIFETDKELWSKLNDR